MYLCPLALTGAVGPLVYYYFRERLINSYIVAKYGKTNFKTNFGSLPIEIHQQPTLSGTKI